MTQRTCSVEGCERSALVRGWCGAHYKQWSESGSASPKTPHRQDLLAKRDEAHLASRSRRTEDGCLLWQGAVDAGGYGQIWHRKRQRLVHRVVWEIQIGPIPAGLFIDHACHNRACIEVSHLRLASPAQNQWNRSGASANSKSGIRNVSWEAGRSRWRVGVIKDGRRYGGYYKTLEGAALAAESLRRELFGAFSGPTPNLDSLSNRNQKESP